MATLQPVRPDTFSDERFNASMATLISMRATLEPTQRWMPIPK